MSDESLPSSLTLIAINSTMVSWSFSVNNLGITLVEEAALQVMQAAQVNQNEGDHISVLSGSPAHSSYSINVGVEVENIMERPSTPYVPHTPSPDSPLPTESSGSEPPLYMPLPPINDSEHPGYPWYSARYINREVQTRMTFEQQTPAQYLHTGISPSSMGPALYGTMGHGQSCYIVDLFSQPYVSTWEESIGGYPLREQMVMDIPLNHALLDLHDHRILADVHCLRQADQQERQNKQWNRWLECLKEFVLGERWEYYDEKRKVAKMCINVEEHFKRAKVATCINNIIECTEPEHESVQWP